MEKLPVPALFVILLSACAGVSPPDPGVEPLVTVHHGHMPEIELTSPTTARGIWAMEDILHTPEDSVNVVHGFGHYHETYERIDGEWRINTLRLTRLRVDRR